MPSPIAGNEGPCPISLDSLRELRRELARRDSERRAFAAAQEQVQSVLGYRGDTFFEGPMTIVSCPVDDINLHFNLGTYGAHTPSS